VSQRERRNCTWWFEVNPIPSRISVHELVHIPAKKARRSKEIIWTIKRIDQLQVSQEVVLIATVLDHLGVHEAARVVLRPVGAPEPVNERLANPICERVVYTQSHVLALGREGGRRGKEELFAFCH